MAQNKHFCLPLKSIALIIESNVISKRNKHFYVSNSVFTIEFVVFLGGEKLQQHAREEVVLKRIKPFS